MEIQRHIILYEGGRWTTEETIQVPNCRATAQGYVEFTWNGKQCRWALPDRVISQLRSGGDFFTMNCTFYVGDRFLSPRAVVVGDELVVPTVTK